MVSPTCFDSVEILRTNFLPPVLVKIEEEDLAMNRAVSTLDKPSCVTLSAIYAQVVFIGHHEVIESAVIFLHLQLLRMRGRIYGLNDWFVNNLDALVSMTVL